MSKGDKFAFGGSSQDSNMDEIAGSDYNGKLIRTLEDNLNTGIGGAINIKYARKSLYK